MRVRGTNGGSDIKRCLSFRQGEGLSWFQCKVSDRFVGLTVDSLLESYASQTAGEHRHMQMCAQPVVPAALRSINPASADLRSSEAALYLDQRRRALQHLKSSVADAGVSRAKSMDPLARYVRRCWVAPPATHETRRVRPSYSTTFIPA